MNDIFALCIMESEGILDTRQGKINKAMKNSKSFQEVECMCRNAGVLNLTDSEKRQIKRALLNN